LVQVQGGSAPRKEGVNRLNQPLFQCRKPNLTSTWLVDWKLPLDPKPMHGLQVLLSSLLHSDPSNQPAWLGTITWHAVAKSCEWPIKMHYPVTLQLAHTITDHKIRWQLAHCIMPMSVIIKL